MQTGTQELRGRRQIAIVAIATGLALAAVGWASGLIGPSRSHEGAFDQPAEFESSAPAAPDSAAAPSAAAVESCNRYAADAERDAKRVIGDAVVGGAVGAGLGAAGGAIAGGDKAPGKGAGIGALVGVTTGTLYGLNEENQRSAAARAAYAECMTRAGYSG
jgi:hypothetical protein